MGVSRNHKAHNSLVQIFQSGSIFESIQDSLESALLCLSQVGLSLQNRTVNMSYGMQARFKAKTGIFGTHPGKGIKVILSYIVRLGPACTMGDSVSQYKKHDLDILFSFQPRLALQFPILLPHSLYLLWSASWPKQWTFFTLLDTTPPFLKTGSHCVAGGLELTL